MKIQLTKKGKAFVCLCGGEFKHPKDLESHVESGQCPKQGPDSASRWIEWVTGIGHATVEKEKVPMSEETKLLLKERNQEKKEEIRAKKKAERQVKRFEREKERRLEKEKKKSAKVKKVSVNDGLNVFARLQTKKATAPRVPKVEESPEERWKRIHAKYPHTIGPLLEYDVEVGKWGTRIRCAKCKSTKRFVYVSDLFQVKLCVDCKAKGVKK